jgi:hypothetical protein
MASAPLNEVLQAQAHVVTKLDLSRQFGANLGRYLGLAGI